MHAEVWYFLPPTVRKTVPGWLPPRAKDAVGVAGVEVLLSDRTESLPGVPGGVGGVNADGGSEDAATFGLHKLHGSNSFALSAETGTERAGSKCLQASVWNLCPNGLQYTAGIGWMLGRSTGVCGGSVASTEVPSC